MSTSPWTTRPDKLFASLASRGMSRLASTLADQNTAYYAAVKNGNLPGLQRILAGLPAISPSVISLDTPVIGIGHVDDCDEQARDMLRQGLQALIPWRKGPFDWFGMYLDAEWQSNMKWERVDAAMSPLIDRLVLDVGCGNAYYGWRMLGKGARAVVGLEPALHYLAQFHAANHYINHPDIWVFPFRLEHLGLDKLQFDSVFSMGVLYHQRDPLAHLAHLFRCLEAGGELILETLVLEQHIGELLIPKGRYAKMRNVYSIPSCPLLLEWLEQIGFQALRLIEICPTTTVEQRATEWMPRESLVDFLDPDHAMKTIEGYPAPRRAVVIGRKP